MANNADSAPIPSTPHWTPGQVVLLAIVSLALGLVGGYYMPTGKTAKMSRPATVAGAPTAPHPAATLEQMKAVADARSAPLLDKLKATPNHGSSFWRKLAPSMVRCTNSRKPRSITIYPCSGNEEIFPCAPNLRRASTTAVTLMVRSHNWIKR